jgi:hypothetical protein
MELLRCLLAARRLRLAPLVLAIGWGPLLAYVGWEHATGATGGNPIGLGLLMLAATPIALILAGVGLMEGLLRWLRGEGC